MSQLANIQIRAMEARRDSLRLKEEAALWKKSIKGFELAPTVLLDSDSYNSKSATKFSVLAEITKLLCANRSVRENGIPTKAIIAGLNSSMPEVSDATLRSYLARFRAEGRLTKDDTTRMWSINHDQG